jgi:hypothetical protein
MESEKWSVVEWSQPAYMADGFVVSVECRQVYALETIGGPVAEAGTVFEKGQPLGWLAWQVDQFGHRVRNGKIRPTFEEAFDTLGLEATDGKQ